jgi:Ribosomal protein L24
MANKVHVRQNDTVVILSGKDKGKKVELKLWELELFRTRGQAAARAKAIGPNMSIYMMATRNGLYVREEPDNTAPNNGVYRLRAGQSVKIFEKVDGVKVTTGDKALPGSWYLVMTDDGTKGYAFSNSFRIYDESKEGAPVVAAAKPALSGRVDIIFSRSWRPEYFQEMAEDGRIDLDYFSLGYGLFIDATKKQIRLELPAASSVFNYTDISEQSGLYSFVGTPLKIKVESDSRILCSWKGATLSGEDSGSEDSSSGAAQPAEEAAPVQTAAAAAPAPGSATENAKGFATDASRFGADGTAAFIVYDGEASETIRLEALRRQQQLRDFVDSSGAVWSASADAPGAGKLELVKNGRFSWKGRAEGAVSFIPSGAGDSGEIAFRLYLDPSLQGTWNGAFSLRFDLADNKRGPWIDLLYRRGPTGLVLAPAKGHAGLDVQAVDARAQDLVLEPASE